MSLLKDKLKKMDSNDRSILTNTIAAFLIKGGGLVLSLFTMPTYLRYFHNETVLGLWFTLLSVLTWILNFDFGIGNGLRNHLARTLATGEYEEAKRYLSASYAALGAICLCIIVCFLGLFQNVNWYRIFHINAQVVSSDALRLSVTIVFVGIILQFFLGQITAVLYAMQKPSVNNLCSLVTKILLVGSLYLLPSGANDGNLITMSVLHVVTMLLPLAVATLAVFSRKTMRRLLPSFRCVRKRYIKDVVSLGGMFFLVQAAYGVVVSTDNYLISWFSDSADVVSYQIYAKFFVLFSSLFILAMSPVWSAVTKAVAEGNKKWIEKLYRRLLLLASLGTLCEFAIIPFLQFAIDLWLGEETITIQYLYCLPFAVLGSLTMLNSVFSSITNGAGKLRVQAVCFGIGALVKIPLSWLLVRLTGSWAGVTIATAACIGLYCLAQPVSIRKWLAALPQCGEQSSVLETEEGGRKDA